MKKTIVFLLAVLSCNFIYSQRTEYGSRVYDGVTYVPIADASIYNFNSKEYAFTDESGNFTIRARANDTLIISKSIYRQIVVILSENEIRNRLNEYFLFYKAILLKEVNVHALNPSYEGFKRDLSNIKLPEIYKRIEGIELSDQEKMDIEYENKGPNLLRNTPAASPITYLYNTFSKKVKAKQLYNEMVEYEDEVEKLPLKYNREIVSEITGLKGDELMEFMVFCRFSYYDLIKWSQEDIVRNVRNKFFDYQYYKALQDE